MGKRKVKHESEDDEDEDFLDTMIEAAPKAKKAKAAFKKASRKKVKGEDGEPVEKRLAIFKKKCPKTILERLDRVLHQRFFMIDREREGDDLEEKFKVLGSTGNVYTITIGSMPSCTCPDGMKGNHCKHKVFVMIKVLGQNWQTSELWYQKALLSTELKQIFGSSFQRQEVELTLLADNAPPSPQDVVNARITAAYKRAEAGEEEPEVEADASGKRRLPQADDSCPICYDDLPEGSATGLVFCETSCGGPVHSACFNQWAAASRAKGEAVKCVFCRAAWPQVGAAAAAAVASTSEGYTNLAGIAGISGVRDTSTYYYGPQRGQRWDGGHSRYGNNDYEQRSFAYARRGRYRFDEGEDFDEEGFL